jgi:hypothetical protein
MNRVVQFQRKERIMLRRTALAAVLSLAALPALAGPMFDLPHLTFPPTVTTSTSDGK